MQICHMINRILHLRSQIIELYSSKYVKGQTDFRKTVFCQMIFFKV